MSPLSAGPLLPTLTRAVVSVLTRGSLLGKACLRLRGRPRLQGEQSGNAPFLKRGKGSWSPGKERKVILVSSSLAWCLYRCHMSHFSKSQLPTDTSPPSHTIVCNALFCFYSMINSGHILRGFNITSVRIPKHQVKWEHEGKVQTRSRMQVCYFTLLLSF